MITNLSTAPVNCSHCTLFSETNTVRVAIPPHCKHLVLKTPSPSIKWRLYPSSRLATIEMGRKLGRGLRPLFGEEAGSPSNTKSTGPKPTSIPSGILISAAIWPQQIRAENWGAVPLWGGGAGSPSNTMWPGPKPTCVPRFILIRLSVWPQCTNVTDRTGQTDRPTGQDNGPIA